MNEINLEKDIMIISNQTIINLFSYDNWADLVALYMFYHKQCKLQSTNQSFTVRDFAKKWLKWWDKRFKDSKKILKELNLIEDISQRNEKWHIIWWFIKLNYLKSLNNTNISSGAETHSMDKTTSGWQETNALNIKDKMLKVNNIKDITLEKVKEYKNNKVILLLFEIVMLDNVKQSFDIKSFINLYDSIINKSKINKLITYIWNNPNPNRDWLMDLLYDLNKRILKGKRPIKSIILTFDTFIENRKNFNNKK